MAPMSDLNRRLSHVTAFEHALGCGIILRTASPVPADLRGRLAAFIETYEATLSRFRADSTVSAMANAPHGGSFVFPAWSAGLFALYDRLFTATSGAIDPCVGEDLVRLGYGIELGRAFRGSSSQASRMRSFPESTPSSHSSSASLAAVPLPSVSPMPSSSTASLPVTQPAGIPVSSANATGATSVRGQRGHNVPTMCPRCPQGTAKAPESPRNGRATDRSWDDMAHNAADRPSWTADVKQHRDPASRTVTLSTRRPVRLDFGAAGKGYLVDLLAVMLREHGIAGPLVIDAGGDLRVEGLGPDSSALRIGLEDPSDADRAVGLAQVNSGSLCASSPSRRHWLGAHHLVNALNGEPSDSVAASWAFVPIGARSSAHPTAVADGLATALFVANPSVLRRSFAYECALLDAGNADRTARCSPGFPGSFFIT